MQEVSKMKKATIVLFVLLCVFITLILGVFIGRQSVTGMMLIPEKPSPVDQSVTSEDDNIIQDRPAGNGKININTASAGMLETLPNIGTVLAQRIVDYRIENGNYTTLDDLLLVEGIGEKRLEEIREYITVGG
jgi:competence ComEA-like helix-hairpin-helix protein